MLYDVSGTVSPPLINSPKFLHDGVHIVQSGADHEREAKFVPVPRTQLTDNDTSGN